MAPPPGSNEPSITFSVVVPHVHDSGEALRQVSAEAGKIADELKQASGEFNPPQPH